MFAAGVDVNHVIKEVSDTNVWTGKGRTKHFEKMCYSMLTAKPLTAIPSRPLLWLAVRAVACRS